MARKPWIKPSTIAFVRGARRTPGYSFFDWLHGYVYARWPYLYIGVGTGEHPLAQFLGPLVRWLGRLLPSRPADDPNRVTVADTYHGKVVPLEAATQLVTVEEDISLADLEQVIPYARARDIVLQNPDHIVVLDCPCRTARPNPCQPIDVCLVVGEPFASFVAEHHPNRSRWITPAEAVEILRAEDERGHVHHAFFKDAMLGRFYAICNCCACCCGAMQAHRHGTPMLASSGYVCRVDADLCVGCTVCADFCQFGALSFPTSTSTLTNDGVAVVDTAACMGCGVCVSKCPQGALALVRDPGKGEPLEIRQLILAASAANAAQ
jgi:NAD-dependent dihydropyrimidine dehydrogenase PreA subunit